VPEKGLKKTYTKTGKEKIEVSDKLITRECMNEIAGYIRRLNDIDSRGMSVQEVIEYLTGEYASELSFTGFADDISGMISDNRAHSASNYQMAVRRLHEYINKTDILFSDITSNALREWINSMMDSPRKRSLYPNCIKAMYHAAMLRYNDEDRDIIRIRRNLFMKITIPKARQPEKRSIRIETIRTFFNAEIPGLFMREEMARDFIISVYKVIMVLTNEGF
jgi:hypothetical protein